MIFRKRLTAPGSENKYVLSIIDYQFQFSWLLSRKLPYAAAKTSRMKGTTAFLQKRLLGAAAAFSLSCHHFK